MAELKISSKTHGTHTIYIDDEDLPLVEGCGMWPYTSKRHSTFYVMVYKNGVTERLHRLVMGVNGSSEIIDHINGNGLDNRKSNLRVGGRFGNNCNAKKRKNARTSKYKGVHFCKTWGTWKAQIQYKKKKYSLGNFKTEVEAARAYNKRAKELHGEYARLNDISEECK